MLPEFVPGHMIGEASTGTATCFLLYLWFSPSFHLSHNLVTAVWGPRLAAWGVHMARQWEMSPSMASLRLLSGSHGARTQVYAGLAFILQGFVQQEDCMATGDPGRRPPLLPPLDLCRFREVGRDVRL